MAPLPPIPAELARIGAIVGDAGVLALLEAHGGTRVYIPREVGPTHPLARLLGLDAARALAADVGGGRLPVPLCRWWRARCYRARGDSYIQIARRLNVTERAAWSYVQGRTKAAAERQLDLKL